MKKKWYQSATIWFNVLTILLTLAGELVTAFPSGAVAKIGTFVITIGNILLRVFKTKVPIE